jgi:beta-lactamase class A
MRRTSRWGAIILGLLAFVTGPRETHAQKPLAGVRAELEARIARHKGKVGLAAIDLTTGETLVLNDEPFPTASVIKVPILFEVFQRVEKGSLRLEDSITVVTADKVGGSGILNLLSTPHRITVRDAATLMIVLSDNTATNVLIDKVGVRAVNARLDTLGFTTTRLYRKVFHPYTESFDTAASSRYGLGVTTPVELARMFEQLYRRTIVSAEASKQMLDIFKEQFSGDRIPRYISGAEVAHKTGEIDAARHDCGIVYAPDRPYVLCILTRENEDKSWRIDNEALVLGAELARSVHQAMLRAGKP